LKHIYRGIKKADVAQLVEQLICNQLVGGSSPSIGSHTFIAIFKLTGGVPERSNGADCKSVGLAFGGSNPPPPTFFYFNDWVFGFRSWCLCQPFIINF
jgi:hypothetical protein